MSRIIWWNVAADILVPEAIQHPTLWQFVERGQINHVPALLCGWHAWMIWRKVSPNRLITLNLIQSVENWCLCQKYISNEEGIKIKEVNYRPGLITSKETPQQATWHRSLHDKDCESQNFSINNEENWCWFDLQKSIQCSYIFQNRHVSVFAGTQDAREAIGEFLSVSDLKPKPEVRFSDKLS